MVQADGRNGSARSGGRLRWRAGLRGEAVDRLSGGGDGMRGGRSSLYPLHSRPSDPPRGPEVVHLAFGGRTQNVRNRPPRVQLADGLWT